MGTCRGVDVSAYQGPQDWGAHKRQGVVFAFAKASEGERMKDTRFGAHIRAIKAAGLIPGAYHFAWPNQDPAAEARNYITAVKPYAGRGFVHWLDLERYADGRNYTGRTAKQIRAWAEEWLTAVRAAFPKQRVGLYTSGADLQAGHAPPGVPLWYPRYPWGGAPYATAEAEPQPQPSGRPALFWQFTSTPIDRNLCYLSEANLRAWAADEEDTPMAGMTDKDICKAAWLTDDVVAVPEGWGRPENDEWKPASLVIDIGKRVRGLEQQMRELQGQMGALMDALSPLTGITRPEPGTGADASGREAAEAEA